MVVVLLFHNSQPSGSEAELLAKRDSLISTLLEMLKSINISPATTPLARSSLHSSDKKRYSYNMFYMLLELSLH